LVTFHVYSGSRSQTLPHTIFPQNKQILQEYALASRSANTSAVGALGSSIVSSVGAATASSSGSGGSSAATGGKSILYCATELLSPCEFLAQLTALGREISQSTPAGAAAAATAAKK
jgi:hypothetical protein